MARRSDPAAVPPHSIAAEESLLGAALLTVEAVEATRHLVVPGDFYKPAHAHIWAAILDAVGDGERPDPVIIADRLRRSGVLDQVGGAGRLVELVANTPATSNAARYAGIIHNDAEGRRLLALAGEIPEILAGSTSTAIAAEAVQTRLEAILAATNIDVDVHAIDADAIASHLDILERRYEAHLEGRALAVPTGFSGIDDLLGGGLRNEEMAVIGARPAHGKSTIAMNMAVTAARAGRKVLIVSVEMGKDEIIDRLFAHTARVSMKRIRTGAFRPDDWGLFARTATGLDFEHPIHLVDDARITIDGVAERMRRGGFDYLVVDYIQLLETAEKHGETRERAVADVSGKLKRLARERSAIAVVLSQLNRNVELRADKRPQLADLRETGSLEQDANVVFGAYRPEVYEPDDRALQGILEMIVLKSRNSPTGTVRLSFLGATATVANMAHVPQGAA